MKKQKRESKVRKITINVILSVSVVAILIARAFRGDWQSVFLCALTLLLFNIPRFANKIFKVTMPRELEIVILLFIFAAEILGEIASFYTHISWWDTMLHTTNGFLMAAIGFALIDILNNSPKFHISLSPLFVAFVAFCFSMTVGVVWEFFEFSMDMMFDTDMQKDFIVGRLSSVTFNPDGLNDVVHLPPVTETVIMSNGEVVYVIEGGYLDIGIIDTMKDLIVNCIGAVVYSFIGYFYLIGRDKRKIASRFIPQYNGTPEKEEK